jgi:NhaP-type Na+/H+ or K+/H+ antiporter
VQLNGPVRDTIAADALLGLLLPFWQLVLGVVIIVFVVGASVRLARRGRSRMNTAILVTGVALVGLVVIGVLAS